MYSKFRYHGALQIPWSYTIVIGELFFSFWRRCCPTHRGLDERTGKYTILKSGLHWISPFIDRIVTRQYNGTDAQCRKAGNPHG